MFWSFVSELWYLCFLWLFLLFFFNVRMNCQVCGCVCVLLLYGRLSSCCELLWDLQLTQSLWAVSHHSLDFFILPWWGCVLLLPPLFPLYYYRGCYGWIFPVLFFSMTTWHSASPSCLPGLPFCHLEHLSSFPSYQDTVPQSFTYLATLLLSSLVPFSKLLFVLCLFLFISL